MAQKNYIKTEFPDELQAIQKLRSENSVFAEICEDLELLGQELALFPKGKELREQEAYSDVLESLQALRHELAEFLQRERVAVDREL